jgi:hypothetical protein
MIINLRVLPAPAPAAEDDVFDSSITFHQSDERTTIARLDSNHQGKGVHASKTGNHVS